MKTTFVECTNHGRQRARQVEVDDPRMMGGRRVVYTKTIVQTTNNGRWVKCGICNYPSEPIVIDATITETECGEKCQSATGTVCECSCGGENHGA